MLGVAPTACPSESVCDGEQLPTCEQAVAVEEIQYVEVTVVLGSMRKTSEVQAIRPLDLLSVDRHTCCSHVLRASFVLC